MIADIPLGAFLSGGIDSSVIVGLMARNASQPVKTYAIGFADMPMYDESTYARQVAAFHRTEHQEIMLTSEEIIDTIPAVLTSFDEPFGDSSAVPTYVVARETPRDVTVALSGDGGDELFAGYRMYKGEAWHRRYCLLPRLLRSGLLEPAIRSLPDSRDNKYGQHLRRIKKFLRGAKETFPDRVFSWNELFSQESKKSLLTDSYVTDRPLAPELFAAALNHLPTDYIDRMLYADLKISLPADMLWKVDAMSMRHSLEVRVPLLDHRVCELAFRIGGEWKLRHGRSKYVFAEKNGVKVIAIPELVRDIHPLKDLKALFALIGVFKNEKPQIVHTHTSKAGILGRWAAFFAKVDIIIHTPHGHVFWGYFNKWKTACFIILERLSAAITDKIITLTEQEKKDHLRFKIAPDKKFTVIHSGIDLTAFSEARINAAAMRAKLGIPPEAIVVGTAGRLTPIKGQRYLLEAAARISPRTGDLFFVFLGDGELADAVAGISSLLGIKNALFLGWRQDVPEVMSTFDIFVLPSLNEGMGKVLIEAMALGKPIVASNVGGIPDLVT
ncbi:MAG: hypothetical protein QG555_595, partial [Thermodesulfobacteriota bacterium]|nr:hypothetical protein [Thermodesulfobacteriota bacterium]